ncbi:MAG: CHASE2 domain-containing protein [Bdellovibrionaceae bacterium]|nr:CHASE2 domain-containing protein [Pseudobdellovibrionaceae bacterium]
MGNINKSEKRIWFYRILRLGLAIASGIAIQFIDLDHFEYLTYDWRMRFRSAPPVSDQIITIAIDKKSIKELGTFTELGTDISADIHLNFLKKLMTQNPHAVIYTINRENDIPIQAERNSVLELADYTLDKPIFIGRDHVFNPSDSTQSQFEEPFHKFKTLQAPITRDRETFGRDTVTRRALISFDGFPTMHSKMAQELNPQAPKSYRGQFDFYGSQQVHINYRPQGAYKPISFVDVVNGNIDLEIFKNKVILVGDDSGSNLSDYVTTPYSRDLLAMSNLEVHANILDTLLMNDAPLKSPPWLSWVLTCLVSILIVFVVLTVKPANGLTVIILTLIGLMSFSFLMFSTFNVFLEITHPVLAVFICYYFFIPYRLILENRKSWEYYHKNKLLTQVEELKSNFMRMMSHDLKTPLARIQGMTEIIRHDNTLKPEQIKALDTIAESSEELTEFIGSILSLGRIEGKEVKLNIQSKDINAILEKVVNKYEYQAQSKNIQIIKELEPLFSVQVDEDLIKQVFANLIENAIKYSPENTKILISTEEKNGKVLIQIADQGIGIDKKDQSEVFTKFHRSPRVTNGPIKGSGLGLYLANYFVNLHSGKILLESELQMGSTFTVELPTELNV